MDVQNQSAIPVTVDGDPAVWSAFEQTIGQANAPAATTAAALAECGYEPPPLTIPVSLLQTHDDSPESAALAGAGRDYRHQLYDGVQSALTIARRAIQLGDEGSGPAVDPVIRGVLSGLGLNVDNAGGVAFANTREGGQLAAVASTSVGNEIPPDISDELAADGARYDFIQGYEETRQLYICRAQEALGGGGPVILLAALGIGGEGPAAASSQTEGLLAGIRPGGEKDLVTLIAGVGLSSNTAHFATTMATTVLASLMAGDGKDAVHSPSPGTRLHLSLLPDRPGYRIEYS